MPPQDFGIPDSYFREGLYMRLHERPDREWSLEDGGGANVGTLIAFVPEVGETEWACVSDERPEPDGYWPTWRLALNDFLDTLD